MKNKKWFNYTLSILLTLVVLTMVAGAGIRFGLAQNASFARPAFTHDFDRMPQAMQGNFDDNNMPQTMQENPHNNGGAQATQGNSQSKGFDTIRGGDRRDGGFSFLWPIFGLIRLAVFGLLVWIGYKFVKKSGWTLSRVQASPAPVVDETPSVEVEEEKPAE